MMKAMSDGVRKVVMVLVAIVNTGWSLMMAFVLLLAESGGKEPEPLNALIVLWLLVEVLVTCAKAVRFVAASSRTRGNPLTEWLLVGALLCRPAVDIAVMYIAPWQHGTAAITATTLVMIALCHILRRHWPSPGASK
jgi:hypothetical protein